MSLPYTSRLLASEAAASRDAGSIEHSRSRRVSWRKKLHNQAKDQKCTDGRTDFALQWDQAWLDLGLHCIPLSCVNTQFLAMKSCASSSWSLVDTAGSPHFCLARRNITYAYRRKGWKELTAGLQISTAAEYYRPDNAHAGQRR